MALSIWVEDINHAHVRRTPVWYAGDHNEVMEYYSAVRHDGGEGVIVKPTGGDYRCTRSRNWLKIKDQQTVDAPIIGLEEGTGKYQGMLGAVIVDLEGVEVRVGSGFTDEERKRLWDDAHADEPWSYNRLIEIEYHEKTPDGSLRHPRFVRFRDDKPVEDGVGV
jgi:DNA ligase-1